MIRKIFAAVLSRTHLRFWPVRVKHGFLRGAAWTLWPHSAYWRGHYEPDVQAALARNAPPEGAVAWDLGAHFGFYTLWLARAVGPAGQVCAFEPDAVSFERLRRHVSMNEMAQVKTYPYATSARAGQQVLVQNQGSGATTSHLPYEGESTEGLNTITVQTIALDDLVARDGLRAPSFVKIDIEGHAASALAGASELLRKARPVILISLHSPDELSGVRSHLEPLGYEPYDLNGAAMQWSATLFQTVVLKSP